MVVFNKERFVFIIFMGFFLFLCACPKESSLSEFDPQNEKQLVEIYVKTNYFKDYSVYAKYDLKGKNGALYTDQIMEISQDRYAWERFIKKTDIYRKKLEEEKKKDQALAK